MMVRQFSRTQRWITFALLLLLGLAFFASLRVDLLNATTQVGDAIASQGYEENEAATIREYFKYRFDQMKDKSGKIPDGALIKALNNRKAMVARQRVSTNGVLAPLAGGIDNTSWTFAGPGNVGGRIRAVLPINASTVFIGSVSGGIWKTTNCCSTSTTWTAVDDFMANLAISSLIVDPTNANVMYAGTGEGFFNADAVRGAGVFKSTDGGTTWSQLTSTNNSDWHFVNRLAISPNGTTLLAATGTNLFRSTNGGTSWSPAFAGDRFLDVRFDPLNSNNAIAATNDVPLYTTNGGLSWNFGTGLPTSGRKELAYAPSAPTIVYVSMENGAIYKSTNGGQSYSQVNANAGHQAGGQGWYDNTIWVNPTNPDNLVVGGLDLYQSTDGGATFTKISEWTESFPNNPASPYADHHALVSIPGSSTALINGSDGGLYYTANIATAGNNPPAYNNGWVALNNNLEVTQFYGVAGNSNGVLYGGAQDNGVLRGTAASANAWTFAFGGDGGKSAADPTDPNYFYNEYTFGKVNRSSDGGGSAQYIFGEYFDGTNFTCRPAPYRIDDACNNQGPFIAPILLDPNNVQRLLVGSLSLWVTNDAKTPVDILSPTANPQWAAIKPSIGSGINAIAVAPSDSNVIWVGYQNSRIDMTTNGGASWTQVDTNIGANHPGTTVGAIAIDKNNSNIVYVGFYGFGLHRLWRTADGGATWTSITNNLPDAPVYAVAINPANSAWLYIGTEIGVFASENTGASWNVPAGPANGDGPANVAVFDLQWMGGGNSTGTTTLIAGTHGRGAWIANIAVSPPTPTPTNTPVPPTPTNTPVTPTNTPVPPTPTNTPVTPTNTPVPPTPTNTPVTPTNTPVPPTPTNTPVTPTNTPLPPTPTNTPTKTATPCVALAVVASGADEINRGCPTATPVSAKITIIKDSQPDSIQNFTFFGPFGSFMLDNAVPDDGDGVSSSISYWVGTGVYNFSEVVPTSWYLSAINCTPAGKVTPNLTQRTVSIRAVAGDDITCTFVNQRRVNLTAIKFNDLNGNKAMEGGEPRLANWAIRFYDSSGVLINQLLTNANGEVVLANRPPGSFKVCEVQQSGWTNTLPMALDPTLKLPCHSATLLPGQNGTFYFGNTQKAIRASEEAATMAGVEITDQDDFEDTSVSEPEDEDVTPKQFLFLPIVTR